MQHIFEKGSKQVTFLLLHGTGGTERDLIGLAKEIDAEANILSVRGQVLENGMPRFFKRLAEGVFDMEDLALRTDELKQFVDKAASEYSFDRSQVVAIGYSNGANIAANLLFRHAGGLAGAILHHPMVPDRDTKVPSMDSVKIWAGAGTNDMMCPPAETNELADILMAAGANVTVDWFDFGHQLTMVEVMAAKNWYQHAFK